jgi:hypothetical protein
VHVVNSTISGNAGPGIDVLKSALTVLSTTVISNIGGGVQTSGSAPEKHKSINNSIVGGNGTYDIAGEFDVLNNNLTGPVTGVLNETLVDNGGPTPTHALLPGSPAIGAGSNAWIPNDAFDLDGDGNTTEPLPVDQRGPGFARVAGFTVDIGAVEAVCSAITIAPATLPNPSVGVTYSQTLSASGGQGLVTFAATGLPPGLTLSSDGVLGGTATAAGTFTVTVTATDEFGCASTQTYTLTIADLNCGIVIGPTTLKTPYLATLYYQQLSVTPSGQYSVTVSAGALPQGVYLFAIGRSWFLGGIPTTPGEYTFTLAATKTNSPCAPTRTFTVIVPATVLPQLTCVAKTGGKQYTARFGYDNSTGAPVTIPVGGDNYFTPGAQGRGQVTTFQTGRVTDAFSVVFTVKNNHTDLALWYLRGPDGVRRPVNVTTATSRCP